MASSNSQRATIVYKVPLVCESDLQLHTVFQCTGFTSLQRLSWPTSDSTGMQVMYRNVHSIPVWWKSSLGQDFTILLYNWACSGFPQLQCMCIHMCILRCSYQFITGVYVLDSGESPTSSSQETLWKHRSSVSCRETARPAELHRLHLSGARPSQPPRLQEICRPSQLLNKLLWCVYETVCVWIGVCLLTCKYCCVVFVILSFPTLNRKCTPQCVYVLSFGAKLVNCEPP